jgi:hypothetical protein
MKWLGVSLLTATGLWLVTAPAGGQDKKISDADIVRLLPGKWENTIDKKPVQGKISMTVKKDNTWSMDGKIEFTLGDKTKVEEFSMTGTWKVADGKVEIAVKKSNPPNPKVKDANVETVLEINDKVLRLRTEPDAKGKTEIHEWKRVN